MQIDDRRDDPLVTASQLEPGKSYELDGKFLMCVELRTSEGWERSELMMVDIDSGRAENRLLSTESYRCLGSYVVLN